MNISNTVYAALRAEESFLDSITLNLKHQIDFHHQFELCITFLGGLLQGGHEKDMTK